VLVRLSAPSQSSRVMRVPRFRAAGSGAAFLICAFIGGKMGSE